MGIPLLKHPLEKEATDAKEDNDDTLEIEPGIIIINSIFRQEETSKEEDMETLLSALCGTATAASCCHMIRR